MTTPAERTRNVIQARRFLVDLTRDDRLPQDIRQEAHQLLRHYPLDSDVLMAGQVEEEAAEHSLFPPVFVSQPEDC